MHRNRRRCIAIAPGYRNASQFRGVLGSIVMAPGYRNASQWRVTLGRIATAHNASGTILTIHIYIYIAVALILPHTPARRNKPRVRAHGAHRNLYTPLIIIQATRKRPRGAPKTVREGQHARAPRGSYSTLLLPHRSGRRSTLRARSSATASACSLRLLAARPARRRKCDRPVRGPAYAPGSPSESRRGRLSPRALSIWPCLWLAGP